MKQKPVTSRWWAFSIRRYAFSRFLQLPEDPTGKEIPKGGGDVGAGTVSGVTFDGARKIGRTFGADFPVTGWKSRGLWGKDRG